MGLEERRHMIVRTALALAAERGSALTTREIARAAGIGEATVFRAFPDKESLLDAVAAEALRPDPVLQRLAAIPLDRPLADRLAQAAGVLGAHLDRMGTVLGALHASGQRARRRALPGGHRAGSEATREALARLFEPDRASLRLPPDRLAEVFAGLLLTRAGTAPAELIDLLLHGALTGGDR
jgi:AcrR family transcriptional regulator